MHTIYMPSPRASSYSTAELARRLGVSVPTVQRWVDLGYLKAWKTVGGHRRIDASSAESFLAEHGLPMSEATAAETAGGASELSILIVDDNPDDRDVLGALASAALPDAHVEAVDNGFQALVAVGRSTPDILITDLAMPHMNGLEMLKQLSRSEPRPKFILAVSAYEPDYVARLGGLPDGVRLVSKPVEPHAFNELLKAAAASLPDRLRP